MAGLRVQGRRCPPKLKGTWSPGKPCALPHPGREQVGSGGRLGEGGCPPDFPSRLASEVPSPELTCCTSNPRNQRQGHCPQPVASSGHLASHQRSVLGPVHSQNRLDDGRSGTEEHGNSE